MTLTESQKQAIKKYRQGSGRLKLNERDRQKYEKDAKMPSKREFQRLSKIDIN